MSKGEAVNRKLDFDGSIPCVVGLRKTTFISMETPPLTLFTIATD